MIGKKINELATELAPLSTDLTIIGDPTTGVSKKITLEQISSLFGGSVSFYTNLAGFPAVGNIDIIYCAKDTNKLYLWSGSAYTEIFPSQALLDTYQLRSEKGNANGYASLDSGGKVPISQLPSSIMEYKGTWNASTNTPTLANGTGDTGDVYICNVAGTVNFGAGAIAFAVGDYVIYSGTIWQRSSGAVGTVTSVALTVGGDAISVSGSPLTTSGTLGLTFNGTTAQYIRGNGTLETFPSLTGFVPYTGATANVDLGTFDLTADIINLNQLKAVGSGGLNIYSNSGTHIALMGGGGGAGVTFYGGIVGTTGAFTSSGSTDTFGITHSSGSGIALNITKGGNGEGLYINKTSGSGNAATIIGTLNATTLVKSGGTSSQFLKADGSVDSNTYYLASNPNAYIPLTALSAGAGISYNNTTGVIASTITQYTDANARAAISETVTGLDYNNTTGVLSLTSGYVIPTTTNETNWNAAYNDKINSAAVTGTTTKTLTLTQQDGGTITASWTDDNTDAVTSVFGRTGAVVATSGDYNTSQVTENTNLYFTNARAIASTLTGYTSGAGTITSSDSILSAIQKLNGNIGALTTGVSSVNGLTGAVTLTTSNIAEGTNLYYTEARVSANTDVAANTAARHNAVTIGTANGLSLSTQVLSLGLASTSTTGALSSTDWNTFNNKQNTLTNPVTGTGTTNYLPKFTGTSTIGNSLLYDNGSQIGTLNNGQISFYTASSYSFTYNGVGIPYFGLAGGVETGGTGNAGVFLSGYDQLKFFTNNVLRATIDNSGNLGLGVTPSAWSVFKAIQINGGNSFVGAATQAEIWSNSYFDGGFKYYGVGLATRYAARDGRFEWYQAPSGAAAGNTITFTQAMTLGTNGGLSIGSTSAAPANGLLVSGNASVGAEMYRPTTDSYLRLNGGGSGVDGASVLMFGNTHPTVAGQLNIAAVGSGSIIFSAGGGTRLTIASTGAATFSSTVTAGGSILISNTTNAYAYQNFGANTGYGWQIGKADNSGGIAPSNGFYIYDLTNSITRMVISQAGLVGIGTTSPSYNLDVHSSAGGSFSTIRSNNGFTGASDGSQILLGNSANFTNAYFRLNGGGNSSQAGVGSLNIGVTEAVPMAFYTSNSERMRIDASGNLLVGTTSSGFDTGTGIRLDRSGQATIRLVGQSSGGEWTMGSSGMQFDARVGYIRFITGANDGAATERMRITSAGELLIGTTSDAGEYKLQVNGRGLFQERLVVNENGNSVQGQFLGVGSGVFGIQIRNNTGSGSGSLALNSDGGNVGIGTTSPTRTFQVNGYISSFDGTTNTEIISSGGVGYFGTSTNHPLVIQTNNAERMRITSGGNVGIGTTAPNEKLDVNGAIQFRSDSVGFGTTTSVGMIDFYNGGTRFLSFGANSSTKGSFSWYQAGQNNNNGSVAMTITTAGNVEINTGSIKTGEPDTGWGRAAIKIGQRQSGEAFSSGGYLPVNVDGTVYYINLYSSTP
jgi:hypothetical protein